MGLQVVLGVGNKLVNLTFVLSLDLLGLLHLSLKAIDGLISLCFGKHAIALGGINTALQIDDTRGTVGAQSVDLLLNLVYIAVDRLEELRLLIDR